MAQRASVATISTHQVEQPVASDLPASPGSGLRLLKEGV